MRRILLAAIVSAALVGGAGGSTAAGAGPATTLPGVIAAVAVGNSPTGLAVNERTGRTYVANFVDNTVSVLNGSTNQSAATLSMIGPFV